MSFITNFIEIVLHIDKYLGILISHYGIWTYLFLFLIVFCETGLVVTPFLPGDSMIFAAGALAGLGSMNIFSLYGIFLAAAILGDTANYSIGRKIGVGILEKENVRFINKEYLKKAQVFYEKHGSMTIVIARFIPIIRTFAPFVAGIGEMKYKKFISYNFVGGFLWVSLFLGGGYFFGNLDIIRKNFSIVLVAIIFISLTPAVIVFINEKRNKNKEDKNELQTETK